MQDDKHSENSKRDGSKHGVRSWFRGPGSVSRDVCTGKGTRKLQHNGNYLKHVSRRESNTEVEPVQWTTAGAPLRSFPAFLTFLPPVASTQLSRAVGFVSTGQITAPPSFLRHADTLTLRLSPTLPEAGPVTWY